MFNGADLAISVEGISKHFGHIRAVDGIDLAVRPGEVVALLGPNGAGKSTTIDMLLGLAPPDRGRVRLWGKPPAEACQEGLVGAMMQTGGLLAMATVAELVDALRSISPHPLGRDEVLRMARVADIADQRADRISGGQTQRVRFALAVAGDPELLVLDEPTVAMDVSTRRSFWASMREWTDRGRTVLFATHYLEEADAYADRVVLMARGKVVADGPTSEVKSAVSGRIIRVTVAASNDDLAALPGVGNVERRGEVALLTCPDSDGALRALLSSYPDAKDIEITSAGLEEAFLALTDTNIDTETDSRTEHTEVAS
jgi:ABC-2 type transport system ATP-binding protein